MTLEARVMNAYLLVFLGGGLGALGRYLATLAVGRAMGTGFPWGTLFVNILGSFVMGVVIAWLAGRSAGDAGLRLFLATGILGGFTTFSAFSLDTVTLYERGALASAGFYVAASVLASILALFAALWMARQI